jgi:hypothetical protein
MPEVTAQDALDWLNTVYRPWYEANYGGGGVQTNSTTNPGDDGGPKAPPPPPPGH